MERYMLRDFAKWAKRAGLSAEVLRGVLDEMERGLVGDRLGANIYKKRIGLAGRGKRGGVRSIVIFRQAELGVFLYGYAKNEKDDLEPYEEEALRSFASGFVRLTPREREARLVSGALVRLGE